MAAVVIYMKSTCPYCQKAKVLLDEKNVSYQEIDINSEPEKRAEMIQRSYGRTTVPQIFINEQHIGGCDDLYALNAQGKLDPLLQTK